MGRLYNPINYPQSWPYDQLDCYSPGFAGALDDLETRQTQVRERVPGSPSYQSSGHQGASERMFNFPWANQGPEAAFQAIKDFRGYSELRSITDDGISNPDISITNFVITERGTGLSPNEYEVTATNDFVAGEQVIISGIVPAEFNGTYTVVNPVSARFYIYSALTDPVDLGMNPISFAGANVKRHPYYIRRIIPHTNPSIPGYLYCSNVRIEPDVPYGADQNGVAQADEGVARVTYQSPMYRILTDKQMKAVHGGAAPNEATLLRYTPMQLDPQAKYQTIPAMSAFRWQTAPQDPVAQTAYVTLSDGDLTVQWLEVPYRAYPRTAISKCLGKSNANDFGHTSSYYGKFTKGTLVMLVPKIENIRMANGDFGFNITYRFKYYPQGANALFRFPTTPGGQLAGAGLTPQQQEAALRPRFDFISTNTRPSGYPFPPASFDSLFVPEP